MHKRTCNFVKPLKVLKSISNKYLKSPQIAKVVIQNISNDRQELDCV